MNYAKGKPNEDQPGWEGAGEWNRKRHDRG